MEISFGNLNFSYSSNMWKKVQKRAVHNLRDRTYNNRLVELNLSSLKYQRHQGDMIMIYQLLHHNLNVDPSDLLTL